MSVKTAWLIRRNLKHVGLGDTHLWETSDGKRFITSIYRGEANCFEVIDGVTCFFPSGGAGVNGCMSCSTHEDAMGQTGYEPISLDAYRELTWQPSTGDGGE